MGFLFEVQVWGYWACDVSQLLRATMNGTAWPTLGLPFWAHSWGTAPTPKLSDFHLLQGQIPWIPPQVQSSSGLTPGAALLEPSGVAAQRWLSDSSSHQSRHWGASNSNQMPNKPQAKAKSSSEAWHREFQQKLLSREFKEQHFCFLPQEDWIWWWTCWDSSVALEKKMCCCWTAKAAKPHLGIWPLARQKSEHKMENLLLGFWTKALLFVQK